MREFTKITLTFTEKITLNVINQSSLKATTSGVDNVRYVYSLFGCEWFRVQKFVISFLKNAVTTLLIFQNNGKVIQIELVLVVCSSIYFRILVSSVASCAPKINLFTQ